LRVSGVGFLRMAMRLCFVGIASEMGSWGLGWGSAAVRSLVVSDSRYGFAD
jgi:hypothetical protein